MTIGIVILNYLAYEDTIECIESIKHQSLQDYQIVVVDNSSSNESFNVLQGKFGNEEKINIIQTTENIGFAKGNNFGIAFLKKKQIQNILVINGDTILSDDHYLATLATVTMDKTIGMIGTKIISRDGRNQNTLPVTLTHQSILTKNLIIVFIMELAARTRLIDLVQRLRKESAEGQSSEQTAPFSTSTKTLDPNAEMLHGAAIFFTENYLKDYIGFYPETFLYYEEEFLALICRRLGFKQLYMPEISIDHKEDASSDKLMNGNKRKALLFKLHIIKKNIGLMKQALRLSENEIREKVSDNASSV
jgi:GT2 family glycosyltransferase